MKSISYNAANRQIVAYEHDEVVAFTKLIDRAATRVLNWIRHDRLSALYDAGGARLRT
jgi:hypothetical protein